MKITHCKVNHITSPTGFTIGKPNFTWLYEGEKEEVVEENRIVLYLDNIEVFSTKWDKHSYLGTEIEYPLEPRKVYQWKVEVKLTNGQYVSSELQTFETGKMQEKWVGKWITVKEDREGRHPIFSTSFDVTKTVSKARLYITGLGLFEPTLNGKKITEEYLLPYCNAYDKWQQVFTFPLHLEKENILSVTLGNGWYKGRFGFDASNTNPAYGEEWKLLCEVHIHYKDGTEEVIGSNENWKVQYSNITFSNIYDGEHVDTRLKLEEGEVVETTHDVPLVDRLSLPVYKKEAFHPTLLHTPKQEEVLDIGQNLAGTFSMKVQEKEGTIIHLQFGEVLQEDCFYRDNLRTAKAEYIFVCNGRPQVIEPHFTFYGFRYVKVEGVTNLSEKDFVAYALYSDFEKIGTLVTGNNKINQLLSNCEWGMKSNYLDVPTDCPQRDERMGWTGDAQVFSKTAMYFIDSYAFFHKYLTDMYYEQCSLEGAVPFVVPAFHINQSCSVWSDAATIIPDNLYTFFGDLRIFKEQYPSMKAWVDYIEKVDGDDHGWGKAFHFGDWLALDGDRSAEAVRGATDESFIAYMYYYKSLKIVEKASKLLNKPYFHYTEKAEEIKKYILDTFYTPSGRCAVMTMTGQILSLKEHFGDDKTSISLLLTLLKRNNDKLATGFVGTPLLCDVLANCKKENEAFTLLFNEESPGWLYEVNLGATTIWERWNSLDDTGKITGIGMNSLNHYSYGSIASWIYSYCAGLKPTSPGFKEVEISPLLDSRLQYLDCNYRSASGTYHIHWKIIDVYTVQVALEIPYGCIAHVHLPYYKEGEGKEEFTITQGNYSFTYSTSKPLTTLITLDTDVPKALKNQKIKEYLETLPLFKQSEFSFSSFTLKEALSSTCKQTESQLDLIEKQLLLLQE